MSKKKSAKKHASKPAQNQPIFSPTRTQKAIIWLLDNKYLVGLATILTLWGGFVGIKDRYFTEKPIVNQHDEFAREKYVTGILYPKFNWDSGFLNIDIGGNISIVELSDLMDGFDYEPRGFIMGGSDPIHFKLKMMYDRLYVSTEFRDINNEVVGIIEYNNWKLLKSNIMDYQNDDQNLEVIDRYNNVLMRYSFVAPDTLKIRGYMVAKSAILVFSDQTVQYGNLTPNYKERAREAISHINKIFDYKKN